MYCAHVHPERESKEKKGNSFISLATILEQITHKFDSTLRCYIGSELYDSLNNNKLHYDPCFFLTTPKTTQPFFDYLNLCELTQRLL